MSDHTAPSCQFAECKSGKDADIRVSENIGDLSYNTIICSECAGVVGLRENSDIPEDAEKVNRLLRDHYWRAMNE